MVAAVFRKEKKKCNYLYQRKGAALIGFFLSDYFFDYLGNSVIITAQLFFLRGYYTVPKAFVSLLRH